MSVRTIATAVACLFSTVSFAHNILPTSTTLCLPDVIGCEAKPLMAWSPQSDNAKYYQRITPLQSRIKLNQHAGNMVPYFGFDDSNTAAQIEFGSHVPQELNWQYLQSMVYFGGSQSGGQVLAPTPGWIQAAHQNGVKISGTIFFSPPVFGGDKEYKAFDDMVTPGPLQTKIAQQLALLADTYGFDGWFINQEIESMDQQKLLGMQSFIHQLHLADPKLIVTWYDDSDPWTFLNNSINALLVDQHKEKTIYNPVFINYGWGNPQQYVSAAKNINYPVANIHYGIDVPDGSLYSWQAQQSYFNRVMPTPNTAYGALTEWDYMALITKTNNGKPGDESLNVMNQNERDFWTNNKSPMSDGASHFVPWFSAVKQLPFNSYFNTGQGNDYFINGIAQQVGVWHDIGQQNILPSWQFSCSSSIHNNTVKVNYDYQQAYQGGASLRVRADYMMANEIITVPLYRVQLKLVDKDIVKIEHYSNQAALRAAICFIINGQSHCSIKRQYKAGQWVEQHEDLSQYAGQVITEIDLKLQAKRIIKRVDYHLGQVFIGSPFSSPGTVDIRPEVTNNCKPGLDCLTWSLIDNAVNYRVYDSAHHFVGATHQGVLAVPHHNATKQEYKVKALAADGSIM
ncbi:MAG: hypothetical protein P1U40_10030 [Coxiellaceae bacterium]|nr:hypothetical protein [Coxiellaceae bacterium]